MSQDSDIQFRIDQYLSNSLTEDEKVMFENDLMINSLLKEKLELSRMAQNAVFKYKLVQIRELAKERTLQGRKKYSVSGKVLITVCLVSLAPLSYFFFLKDKPEYVKKTVYQKPEFFTGENAELKSNPVIKCYKPKLKKSDAGSVNATINTKEEVNDTWILSDTGYNHHRLVTESRQQLVINSIDSVEKFSVPENSCNSSEISAHVISEASCSGQNTGRILVSSIKGGKAPYKVSIIDQNLEDRTQTNLSPGAYTVFISDINNCTAELPIINIENDFCEKNFEINPDLGEVLNLGKESSGALLRIFDQNENVYFEKTFHSGEQIIWNGISGKGEIKQGYYLFILKNDHHKAREGSVTIVK